MYLVKLMLRSLRRHRERGRRLAILIGLCIAAIVLCLAMMDSFYNRYIALFVDTTTAHLALVHPQAAELKRKPWKRAAEGLSLIRAQPALLEFLRSIEGVALAEPIIRTPGEFLVLSGEPQGATTLVGVDPAHLSALYPALRIVTGEGPGSLADARRLASGGTLADVPVLRRSIQFWESARMAADRVTAGDLRVKGEGLTAFIDKLKATFPGRFAALAQSTPEAVAAALDSAIDDVALHRDIATARRGSDDWRLQEAILDAESLGAAEPTAKRVRYVNKTLLGALFPEAISPVSDAIELGVAMTFQTSPAKDLTAISLPVVIPIRFTGFVETMPLYGFESFIDRALLADYLKLTPEEVTEIAIRLAQPAALEAVRARIQGYLDEHRLDYAVLDYREMGAGYLPTAVGFKIGLAILIGLFVVVVVIFVGNMVLLAIFKRRREIGTAVALGMRPGEYALIFLGEIAVIVTLAGIGGGLLGAVLVALFAHYGIPGVVFFPNGLLRLDPTLRHPLLAYLVVLPAALAAALIPLRRVLALKPVEALRESQ